MYMYAGTYVYVCLSVNYIYFSLCVDMNLLTEFYLGFQNPLTTLANFHLPSLLRYNYKNFLFS